MNEHAETRSARDVGTQSGTTMPAPIRRQRYSFWRHTIRQGAFWWHALRVLAFLACAHTIVAVSLVPIFGILVAMVYTVIPPMATFAAYESIRVAPLFALLCLALAVVAAGTLWPLARTVAHALPFFPRIFALLLLAIWVPTLSAESLRWALMQNEIVQTQPQCHGSRTLLASVRARNEFLADIDHRRIPHGWMLKDGEIRLWSYRRLRFEPAPGWRGIATCADAARETDPHAGQRW